jgi:hypothetical protein
MASTKEAGCRDGALASDKPEGDHGDLLAIGKFHSEGGYRLIRSLRNISRIKPA